MWVVHKNVSHSSALWVIKLCMCPSYEGNPLKTQNLTGPIDLPLKKSTNLCYHMNAEQLFFLFFFFYTPPVHFNHVSDMFAIYAKRKEAH